MAEDVALAELLRLRRRVARERSRYRRIFRTTNDALSRERAYGEESVCAMIIGFIDQQVKALS